MNDEPPTIPETLILNESSNDRLERLRPSARSKPSYNPRYSKFVRRMRLILPLIALGIVAIIFTWGNMSEESFVSTKDPANAPKSIGKNELLNPRFESIDEKGQPFTITAKRALQGKENDNLVILEEPVGDMMLEGGSWIAIESDQGAFRQDNQRLLMRGNVRLFHDQGYQMSMEQLNIDMKGNTAWSETPVYGQGPEGTLSAQGLNADSNKEILIFTGPATLVLNMGDKNSGLGGLF